MNVFIGSCSVEVWSFRNDFVKYGMFDIQDPEAQ